MGDVPTRSARRAALALICAALVALLAGEATRSIRLLEALEHWSSDWRTALFADRMRSQHPHLAVVLVDDDTVATLPYRLPVDRGLLARLVATIDDAGAHVIALDFLFERPTEPAKDQALIDALRKARAKVVLGGIDQRVRMRPEQRAYLDKFITATTRPAGYVNLRYDLDGVVRGEAEPVATAGKPMPDSFAQAITRATGMPVTAPAGRIAWLGPPDDGSDIFLTLPAGQIVAPANAIERKLAETLLAGLRGRIVLVGGDLSDQTDRHPNPLSRLTGEPQPGVMIHAQAVAQAIDGRTLRRLPPSWTSALAFVMALAGCLLGWRYRVNSTLTLTMPVLLLFALGAILLAGFRITLPFAEPTLAWAVAVVAGGGARWLSRRNRYAVDETT